MISFVVPESIESQYKDCLPPFNLSMECQDPWRLHRLSTCPSQPTGMTWFGTK